MRALAAIYRYELLMQIRSARFYGMCALALPIGFQLYVQGSLRQVHQFGESQLSVGLLIFYAIPVVFAALSSMGRIRSTGMASILLTKPFPTLALPLGQALAASTASTLIIALFLFPPGLALRWQYDIRFPLSPVFYALLFHLGPGVVCITTLALWIRSCFKSNLVALIALGAVFTAAGFFANKNSLMFVGGPTPTHRFLPMISHFSAAYWREVATLVDTGVVSFFDAIDWADFGLSLFYSTIFLILCCYHMRRTEPHRKVTGHWRRWFHTPTIARILADLRIDPHVSWRMHAALAAMAAVIGAKTVWPLIERPALDLVNGVDRKALDARYSAEAIPQERLFAPTILGSREEVRRDRLRAEFSLAIDGDPSGKVAVFSANGRNEYRVTALRVDGRDAPFHWSEPNYFIEGDAFASADGGERTLEIEAERWVATGQRGGGGDLARIPFRGYDFMDAKRDFAWSPDGSRPAEFTSERDARWPIELRVAMAPSARLLQSPVEPTILDESDARFFEFDVPARLSYRGSGFTISRFGATAAIEAPTPDWPIRVALPRSLEEPLEQMLELAAPVIAEVCERRGILNDRPITIVGMPGRDWVAALETLNFFGSHFAGSGADWFVDRINWQLVIFEDSLMKAIVAEDLMRGAPQASPLAASLQSFVTSNWRRGVNRSMIADREFLAPAFEPARDERLNAQEARELQERPRAELFNPALGLRYPPLVSMLYLILGHDPWSEMLGELKKAMVEEDLTADLLQRVAEATTGEDFGWFFDYWCRQGSGFPSYRIGFARARMVTVGIEETTMYDVEVEVSNVGTGRMPAPIRIETSNDAIDEKLWLGPGETKTWRVRSRYMPKSALIDPDGWIMSAPYWDEETRQFIREAKAPVKMEAAG